MKMPVTEKTGCFLINKLIFRGMNSIKMTNKDEMKRGRDAGMVGAPNLSRNHRRRVKNTLSFIFVMIYLAFLFINSQSPSFFKGGLSAIFAEAGHTKIKVWRGPTKGDHKHSTASFGYWFHHDGQLEGGHSHQHQRRHHHPKTPHNTGHYNPGMYGAHSYLHTQRKLPQLTVTPTPETTPRANIDRQFPTLASDVVEETSGSIRIPVGSTKQKMTPLFSNAQG